MPYFPTAEEYVDAEMRAREFEARGRQQAFEQNLQALPPAKRKQVRYAQSLAQQGYDPAGLSAAISAGQDVTKIRPTRRSIKTPEQLERERISLERAKLGLEKAKAPKAPKLQEYTDPETGAMFFEENLSGGQVRRTPQMEEGTQAQLYRGKERAFKGVRYDESGMPIPWTMDRGSYGEAKDYREDAPKFKEYTDPTTGQVMRTYEGEQGVVTQGAKTGEGFQRYDPKAKFKWQQEADPLLGVPTVESEYRVDEMGRPVSDWSMKPTKEVENLHANALRFSQAADKELQRQFQRIASLKYGIQDAKSAGDETKAQMKQQALAQAERAVQGIQQRKAEADDRIAQIEAKLQEQGTLMRMKRVTPEAAGGEFQLPMPEQGTGRGKAPSYDEGEMPESGGKFTQKEEGNLTKKPTQGKQVVRRMRNKRTGEIMEVYSDGTSQLIK